MSQVTSFVICFLMAALRSRLSLRLEVAAFRHQLCVYQGSRQRPIRQMWRPNPTWGPLRIVGETQTLGIDRPVNSPELDEVIEFPAVHGRHHYYLRQAA